MLSFFSDTTPTSVILTGSIAYDRIMTFDGSYAELIQPDKLHVLSISPIVREMKVTRGGTAGNIAFNLALLGDKPLLLASVGPDSQEYMSDLAALGVDTSHVHESTLLTSTFSVLNDRKNCQVGGFYPGAMSDSQALTLEPVAPKDSFVVISAHDPATMMSQVSEAHALGLRLFFDPGQQTHILSGEQLRAGIASAEVVIVNDYELGMIIDKTGWSEQELRQKIPKLVVTLGEKGCRTWDRSTSETNDVSAVTDVKVVDPTGAGDAFRAGFIHGYLGGCSITISSQIGATCAAYAVEKHGTQEHSFSLLELENRYDQNFA